MPGIVKKGISYRKGCCRQVQIEVEQKRRASGRKNEAVADSIMAEKRVLLPNHFHI